MIDLRSDTVTTPTDAMRQAARDAEVGDDVYGEDPSVNELESEAADLLGHEAALFCPSGTMANQVAVRTHAERGQEVLVDGRAHVYDWEVGGLVEHAGVQPRTFDVAASEGASASAGGDSAADGNGSAADGASAGSTADGAGSPTDGQQAAANRGVPTPAAVRDAYVEESVHRAGTGLLCLENTHNARGGLAIAPERIDAAASAAHQLDVPVHLDGARLANAAVAHDIPVARFTDRVDSTMLSLSKGLGAPVGSVLAGSEAFVERARRNRKLHGGAMRQAGVVAAPAQLALDAVDRLETDHRNAERLADGLDDVAGLAARPPETNIVLVELGEALAAEGGDAGGAGDGSGSGDGTEGAGDAGGADAEGASHVDETVDAAAFQERCAAAGVGCTVMHERLARFVTHRDVDADDVDEAIERVRDAVGD